MLYFALASLLALPNASASPSATPSVDAVFESLERVHHFHDAAIAPDGKHAAWSVKAREGDGPERLGLIYVAELPSGVPKRLSAARDGKAHRELGAVFSPDGQTIAFLSDAAKDRQLQVYVAPAAGGRARRLTRVEGQLEHLRWSPDGKTIAVLFVAGSTQEPGALVAYKPDSGVVEEALEEQRIAIVDVEDRRRAPGQPRRPVRLRLRLVAGRPALRGRGGEGLRHQQLLDRAALHRRGRHGEDARRSGSRRCRSPVRAGRPTGSRSR